MKLGDALPLFVLLGSLRGKSEALRLAAEQLDRSHQHAKAYRAELVASLPADAAQAFDKALRPLVDRLGELAAHLAQAAEVDAQRIAGAERAALRAAEIIEAERRALAPLHVRVASAAAGAVRGARAGWKRA